MYMTLLDDVQEREPDYGRWTYEEEMREWYVSPLITERYQPIYDPPKQAESAAQFGKPSGLFSRISSTFFYHHADSPDGGGRPYSVEPINVGHWSVAPDGSWIWSPRGWMDTQNPNRAPIARRQPASWSAGIPEIGAE